MEDEFREKIINRYSQRSVECLSDCKKSHLQIIDNWKNVIQECNDKILFHKEVIKIINDILKEKKQDLKAISNE